MQGQNTEDPSRTDAKAAHWRRKAFETQLLNVVPDLRALARFLTRNPAEAEDLVQDTVVRALKAWEQFDLDTSMKAWTFTILRNVRLNALRRQRFDELSDGMLATLESRPNQEDCVQLRQVLRAMDKLSASHREVIALVRGAGCSYEEAAHVMKCNIGTIKSRLNRADAALRDVLGPEFRSDRGSGRGERAERERPAQETA